MRSINHNRCRLVVFFLLITLFLTACMSEPGVEPTLNTERYMGTEKQSEETTTISPQLESDDEIPSLSFGDIKIPSNITGLQMFFSDSDTVLLTCRLPNGEYRDFGEVKMAGDASLLHDLDQFENLEELALQGYDGPLAFLNDKVTSLRLVDCNVSVLDSGNLRWLSMTDCTGVEWGNIARFTALETLYLCGTFPEYLSCLGAMSGLKTLILCIPFDASYEGDWPIVLDREHTQIPALEGLPYSAEAMQAFLNEKDVVIRLQLCN